MAWDNMEYDNQDIEIMVSHIKTMTEITFWKTLFFKELNESNEEYNLLVMEPNKFYAKAIVSVNWKDIYISYYATEKAWRDIEQEIVLEEIIKLMEDKKIRFYKHRK
jgi:hypothetical protein